MTTALFAALGGSAAVGQLAATATRPGALLAFQVSLLVAACVALASAVLLKSGRTSGGQ